MPEKKEQVAQKGYLPILRSVSVVGIMTALSRVLGLVREIVMGHFFGTSALKSAFDVAYVAPNLFRRLFGEGALTSAFVPIFGAMLEKKGRVDAFRFAWKAVSLLAVFLSILVAVGILLSFPLEAILPQGSRYALPLPMIRIMLPYALLICVAALFSGILNTMRIFAIPAITPLLLNAVWLLAMFAVFPLFPDRQEVQIQILCWSVLVAGIVQLVFLLPSLVKTGGAIRLSLRGVIQDPAIRRVLTNMIPATVGAGLIQVNLCMDKALAFYADQSGPAALEYSERLVYLPMGMFTTAFVTVLLPTFSRQFGQRDLHAMRDTLERSMRQLALIMVPCSIALLVLAKPVVSLIYRSGKFDDLSVLLSARALGAYAPGLLFFSFYKTLTPAFYAMRDLKTPLKVSCLGIAINLIADVTCIYFLPEGWKHVGIAIATVITSIVTGTVLSIILYRKIHAPRPLYFVFPVLKMILCAILMGVSVLWILPHVTMLLLGFFPDGKLVEIAAMSITILFGIGIYLAGIAVLDRPDLKGVLEDILHRRKRR